MTPGDREALEALQRRLEHAAGAAMLLADTGSVGPDQGNAMYLVAYSLEESIDRLGSIIRIASAA